MVLNLYGSADPYKLQRDPRTPKVSIATTCVHMNHCRRGINGYFCDLRGPPEPFLRAPLGSIDPWLRTYGLKTKNTVSNWFFWEGVTPIMVDPYINHA